MEKLKVSLEQAQKLFETCVPHPGIESTDLEECHGRILAEPVYAEITQPPFPRSAMDGFAVRKQDIEGADPKHPVALNVVERICAGDVPEHELGENEAARIMTGAMIPAGADCVVKQEDTDYAQSDKEKCMACIEEIETEMEPGAREGQKIQIYRETELGENCCPKGEDFRKGELLADVGMTADAYLIAAVLAAGVRTVKVFRPLKVAVITTGDELQKADTELKPGKIYDANGIWLCTRVKEMGCKLVSYQIAGDDTGRIKKEIEDAVRQADLILTTGGVSVGEKDLLPDVIEQLNGEILFHGIRVKPGMPTMLSVVEKVPVLSLSGNPFAVMAVFEMLVGNLLTDMQESPYAQKKKTLLLEKAFAKTGQMRRIAKGKQEGTEVFLPQIQRNGQLKNGIGTDCLVIFPEGEKVYPEGTQVTVIEI